MTREPITIQSGDAVAANTVEMEYPADRRPLRFLADRHGCCGRRLTGVASDGTNRCAVLYSTTAPGPDRPNGHSAVRIP